MPCAITECYGSNSGAPVTLYVSGTFGTAGDLSTATQLVGDMSPNGFAVANTYPTGNFNLGIPTSSGIRAVTCSAVSVSGATVTGATTVTAINTATTITVGSNSTFSSSGGTGMITTFLGVYPFTYGGKSSTTGLTGVVVTGAAANVANGAAISNAVPYIAGLSFWHGEAGLSMLYQANISTLMNDASVVNLPSYPGNWAEFAWAGESFV